MVSIVINEINKIGLINPEAVALESGNLTVSYQQLIHLVNTTSAALQGAKGVGILIDNGPVWAIVDLACLKANTPCIPIPGFFSSEQMIHAIDDAGVDLLMTDQAEHIENLLIEASKVVINKIELNILGKRVTKFSIEPTLQHLPLNSAKVTYTSGTTGNPKGVCLDEVTMLDVAISLKCATKASTQDVHLCMLPLSTLLENIAGIYVPLISGASIFLPSLAEVGFSGSTNIDFEKMLQVIKTSHATTIILTPELLRGLLSACEQENTMPSELRFVAVGGALVEPALLERAQKLGMPVYEGYGLSECASVVALNTPDSNKQGSVGKPLSHVNCRIEADGEIFVKGSQLLGYTKNDYSPKQDYLPTGDIGHLDEDGYLYITGRKKNIFITSFGRNVSPDWVERALTNHPNIFQAAVFGEAKPFNVAVIVPNISAHYKDIQSAIFTVNQSLPDYAQVKAWVLANPYFSPQNGLLTTNFRLKRQAIYQHYQSEIEILYEERQRRVL